MKMKESLLATGDHPMHEIQNIEDSEFTDKLIDFAVSFQRFSFQHEIFNTENVEDSIEDQNNDLEWKLKLMQSENQ